MYCPNFNDEFYKELSERFSKDAAYLFNTRLESPEIKDWLTKDIKIHFQGNDVIIENAHGAKWDFGKEIKELNLSNKEDNNKIAVSELFESNPKLANAVYSAMRLTTIDESKITYTDEDGNPCAKMGGRSPKFTKGSQWEIVKDLKGYPSHAQGGVDIKLGKNGFSFTRNNGVIEAKHGLVLPKIK